MSPLTVDDLLSLEEYASRRREFVDSHRRYLDRYRRVRIGPHVTLVFENRQTLWFRVQEILRVARLADGPRLQEELDLYNRLLPGRDRLQAVLLIEGTADPRLVREMQGDDLSFRIGAAAFRSRLVTCRPEDRMIGAAHWVEFALDASGRQHLADSKQTAFFEVDHPSYRHKSPPLGDEVRQSLMEDLALSDKDPLPAAA